MANYTYPIIDKIADPFLKECLRRIIQKLQALEATTKGGLSGTLNPDQRSRGLDASAIGARFYAIDYARTYVWTGTAWRDAPDAVPRYLVAFFQSTPEPAYGWALCDGRGVQRSTSTGGTMAFTTPVVADYGGLKAWIRL